VSYTAPLGKTPVLASMNRPLTLKCDRVSAIRVSLYKCLFLESLQFLANYK